MHVYHMYVRVYKFRHLGKSKALSVENRRQVIFDIHECLLIHTPVAK